MDSFFLINKPIGITSFDVIRKLRKLLNIKKLGHTGTLDPLATGGLLIATGNYTKLITYLEKETKVYEFTAKFDGTSDSLDLGTEVKYIDKDLFQKIKSKLKKEDLEKILKEKFNGIIEQIPPKYSALKIGGKKAVDLVRKGKDFELKKRKCQIFEIKILKFSFPEVSFETKVSSGTYIRSIASDLGEIIGTGGYVTKLKRTKIGNLDLSLSTPLDDFDSKNFLDVKKLFDKNIFIKLDEDTLKKINNGLSIIGNFDFHVGKNLFVFDGKFITNIVFFDGKKLIAKRKIIHN